MKTLSLASFLLTLIKKFAPKGQLHHGLLIGFSSDQKQWKNQYGYLLALRHNGHILILESIFEERMIIDTSDIPMKLTILTDNEANLRLLLEQSALFENYYPLDLISIGEVTCIIDQLQVYKNANILAEFHQQIVILKTIHDK